jgi:hypothetical protein
MFKLPDNQKVPVSIAFTDAAGNPAPVDGVPVWTASDNGTLLTLEVSTDGMFCMIIANGPLGTAQVNVSADADLGAGVVTITGLLDIEVVAGQAVNVMINPGTPVDK